MWTGRSRAIFLCGVDGGDEDPPDRAAGTSERVKAGEVGNACTLKQLQPVLRLITFLRFRAKKNTDRPKGQSVFLVGEDGFPLTGINFDSIFRAKKNTNHPKGQLVFLVGEDGFEPSKALPADLQSVPFGHSGIPPYAIRQ